MPTTPIPALHRRAIRVRGVVQGVGYRPFFYRLAQEESLTGWVSNDTQGVLAEVEGPPAQVARFLHRLRTEKPPLVRVDAVEEAELTPTGETGFTIHLSEHSGDARTGIPADAATCPDCLSELLDPSDRRFRYPFLNCTNCGPRFTITRRVPYDRPQTSMAVFPMCPACRQEYDDPANRRFHAQPNACPVCGPQVEFISADPSGPILDQDPIQEAIRRLAHGQILAIKGIGGFHLAVDATNQAAVDRLRQRKHRAGKPFAVMVRDLAAARALCQLSPEEIDVLTSVERPVVLLRRTGDPGSPATDAIAPSVAPGIPWLGLFLPYAPLHHLLFADGRLTALVMTSANLSDEPICIDNDEARTRLHGIADGFLLHNREILQRTDDSVAAIVAGQPQLIRRARGYVPLSVPLPLDAPPLLAVGGQMKSVFTLARGPHAYQSQHLGDLEQRPTLEFFEHALAHLQTTFQLTPQAVAHDLHPEYLSTAWAQDYASARNLPLIGIQHHHAHVAACLAENGLTAPALGLALDGTGYGTDGTVWGGELLHFDLRTFTRTASLRPIPMPGGGVAITQPWRMALSAIATLIGPEATTGLGFPERESALLLQLLAKGKAGPLTSSCGRLFDAVAAIILHRHIVDYEAQAAIELEGIASDADYGGYPVELTQNGDFWLIEPVTMLSRLLREHQEGVEPAILASRFHRWVAVAFSGVVERTREATGISTVCLSGGCLHNRLLTRMLIEELGSIGCKVLLHRDVSPGDGGLSYGQAAIAAARLNQP